MISSFSKKLLVMAVVCLGLSFTRVAWAMPALEREEAVQQPGGAKIRIITRGDEWTNWTETTAGFMVAPGADGVWYYVESYKAGQLVLSDVAAHSAPPAGLRQRISPPAVNSPNARSAPGVAPTGPFTGKILFILTGFANSAGTTSAASWASLIQNNIADYFNKSSLGDVTLLPATESHGTSNDGVVGWVNLPSNHPNTGSVIDVRNKNLTKSAILAADPFVNYALYDTNNDGFIAPAELAVVVIAAGYEGAYTTTQPNVWAHVWQINSNPPIVDGKSVGGSGYTQLGEVHLDHQATMGIMVHELAHLIFGLPDLYDYDGSSSGIGTFGVMGAGSWGSSSDDVWAGQTPVLPTAWSMLDRGWVTGTEGSGTESLVASGSNTATADNTVRKASTSAPSQYFLAQTARIRVTTGAWKDYLVQGSVAASTYFTSTKHNP
jgi:M6 family metalloprotease-like protein